VKTTDGLSKGTVGAAEVVDAESRRVLAAAETRPIKRVLSRRGASVMGNVSGGNEVTIYSPFRAGLRNYSSRKGRKWLDEGVDSSLTASHPV
jgi:hypothetical protein